MKNITNSLLIFDEEKKKKMRKNMTPHFSWFNLILSIDSHHSLLDVQLAANFP